MSSIDERIVEMKFNNAQFQEGIKESTASLDDLSDSLKLDGAADGLSQIEGAASKFSLAGIGEAVQGISGKFSALGAVGFTVVNELTKSAMDLGKRLGSAVLEPIVQGGWKRALNMEQARFQFEGLGMDVEKTMEAANYAVQGTAFGLDEAAVLAANFGATGMEAGDEMANALRGVSGVAAMAGASYSDVGNIFGKVAGQGRLMGDDLNRLAARGVNAAATMSEQMGITEAEFRKMVSEGKITFDMFAEGMNEAFGDHATKANETFTGSLANMRAALARIGAEVATPMLTNLRDIFNGLTPLINDVKDALGPAFEEIEKFMSLGTKNFVGFLEGLDLSFLETVIPDVIDTIKIAASTAMSFLKPLLDAFGNIFELPSLEGFQRANGALQDLLETFKLSKAEGEQLRRTFEGVFAIFDIGFIIIGEIIGVVGRLLGVTSNTANGFLGFTATIGDMIVAFRDALKEGDALKVIFGALETVVGGLLNVVGWVGESLSGIFGFFSDLDLSGATEGASNLERAMSPLAALGGLIQAAWGAVAGIFTSIVTALAPFATVVARWVGDLGQSISEGIQNINWNKVLDIVNTALLGGIVVLFKKFIDNMGTFTGSSGLDGIIGKITGAFSPLTQTLEAMQAKLKADTLLKIAGAVGILAISVVALSMIDSVALTKALTAITVMFTQLMGAMSIFSKIAAGPTLVNMPIMAASLMILAGAIGILSISVLMLSRLSWDEMLRGLVALTGLLTIMSSAAQVFSANSGSFLRAGISMIPLAIGIRLMADAVQKFGQMSWREVGAGLTGLAGSLVSIGIAMQLMPKGMILKAAGVVILASALGMIADAMQKLGGMSWEEIGKGLVTLAGALAIMAVSLSLMNGTVLGSAAMVIAAHALETLLPTVQAFGGMDWMEILKGLTGLAGSLVILAGGLYLMSGTLMGSASLIVAAHALETLTPSLLAMGELDWVSIGKIGTVLAGSLLILAGGMALMTTALPGAAALFVISAALQVLVPVLQSIATMSWEDIGKALATIAGAFLTLGLSVAFITPIIPALYGLAGAIVLLGAGVALAGVGMLAFATGLTAVSVALAATTVSITAMISALIGLIPAIFVALADGIVAFADVIARSITKLIESVVVIVSGVLDAIIELVPKIVETFAVIITAILEKARELEPEFRTTAVQFFLGLLVAIEEVAPRVNETMSNLLYGLMLRIEEDVPKFSDKGADIIVAVIEGIERNMTRIQTAGTNLVVAFIRGVSNHQKSIVDEGARMIVSIIEGVGRNASLIVTTAVNTVISFAETVAGQTQRMVDAGFTITIGLINGIADTVRNRAPELRAAGGNLATAIIDGLTGGLASKVKTVADSAINVAKSALNSAKNFLGIQSPSKEFYALGEFSGEGLALGISHMSGAVEKASEGVAENALNALQSSLKDPMGDILDDFDMSPTITPIVDLSQARLGMDELSNYADKAYLTAQAVGRNVDSNRRVEYEGSHGSKTEIKFEQTNHSPKALDKTEIYRQTKNLVSLTKGALKV